MGVPLGRRDAGMAEHLLHMSQVDAASDEVGSKTVPERVRGDVRRKPCRGGMVANNLPDSHPRKAVAPA